MAYVLFTTSACHLCEQAQQLLVEAAAHIYMDVYIEDIAETDALIERYGKRIPVLKNEQNGRELDWPFTQHELLTWLNHRESQS